MQIETIISSEPHFMRMSRLSKVSRNMSADVNKVSMKRVTS
jgi:hypothetical protein